MIDCYYNMFGIKPKLSFSLPLENGNYHELDTSEHLDPYGIYKYQSMISSIQCAVSLGRLDVNATLITLASFRDDPR